MSVSDYEKVWRFKLASEKLHSAARLVYEAGDIETWEVIADLRDQQRTRAFDIEARADLYPERS